MLGPKHPDFIATQFDLIELLQLVGDAEAAAQVLSLLLRYWYSVYYCVTGTTVPILTQ